MDLTFIHTAHLARYWTHFLFKICESPLSVQLLRRSLLSYLAYVTFGRLLAWLPARSNLLHFLCLASPCPLTQVQVILPPTVSRPVCRGVVQVTLRSSPTELVVTSCCLIWDCWFTFFSPLTTLQLSFNCPLTSSSSTSYIVTDGQSASSSWCWAPFETHGQILLFFVWQLLSFFFV
jgi:hypothetical protein